MMEGGGIRIDDLQNSGAFYMKMPHLSLASFVSAITSQMRLGCVAQKWLVQDHLGVVRFTGHCLGPIASKGCRTRGEDRLFKPGSYEGTEYAIATSSLLRFKRTEERMFGEERTCGLGLMHCHFTLGSDLILRSNVSPVCFDRRETHASGSECI
jgi:hypothetical protein